MADTPRATISFSYDKYGWSETYWRTSTTDLLNFSKEAIALINARTGMNGAGVVAQQVRVSFDSEKGDAITNYAADLQQKPQGAIDGVDGSDPDSPYSVTQVRLQMGEAGSHWSNIYLSGLPDVLQVAKQGPKFSAEMDKRYKKYSDILTSGIWGKKCIRNDGAFARRKAQSALAVAGPVTITLPGHGLAVGTVIRSAGWTGVGDININGIFTVGTVPDADSFTLLGLTGTFAWAKQGYIQKRDYRVEQITSAVVLGQTHRKRGLGVFGYKGRRKK